MWKERLFFLTFQKEVARPNCHAATTSDPWLVWKLNSMKQNKNREARRKGKEKWRPGKKKKGREERRVDLQTRKGRRRRKGKKEGIDDDMVGCFWPVSDSPYKAFLSQLSERGCKATKRHATSPRNARQCNLWKFFPWHPRLHLTHDRLESGTLRTGSQSNKAWRKGCRKKGKERKGKERQGQGKAREDKKARVDRLGGWVGYNMTCCAVSDLFLHDSSWTWIAT